MGGRDGLPCHLRVTLL